MNYLLINKRYIVGKSIGSGSFGELYCGVNKDDRNEIVAIKLENKNNQSQLLKFEAQVYQYLYQPNKGIPKLYWTGIQDDYNVMVTEMLGPNLENLFDLCGRKFSLKTVLMLGTELIKRIQYVHSKKIIHRDIKPENFLIGYQSNDIYIIDFGLCKSIKGKDGKHIPFNDKKSLIGTIRYAGINSHKGYELSRRDDLESIGYMLIYFLKGQLPWQSFNNKFCNKNDKYKFIYECKLNTTTEKLCQGLPKEFTIYMDYVKSLDFDEKPNYNYIYGLFSQLMTKHNYQYDDKYDWTLINKEHIKI